MPEHSYLSPVEPDDAFTVRRVDFVALAELGPRSDYVWARVDPCLKYPDNAEGESFEYVALRPRREGDSILEPIEWPVAVSVVVPTRGELQLAARIDGDDGRLLYRGLSHRTLAEALCNDPLPRAEQYEPRFRCARPGEEGRSDLIVIDCSELTKAHFAYLPCWSWVDGNYFMADDGFPFDEDAVTPHTEFDPLPRDANPDFIKAEFCTPAGFHFDGYIVGGHHVHAINLFVDGSQFGFNVFMKDYAERELRRLQQALKTNDLQVFPLRYTTRLRFEHENEQLAGTFDPFATSW